MSSLVINKPDNEKVSYSGTQFDGLENKGNKHLCVRTGTGSTGIKKYGLTTSPINDRYSNMKMRISTGGGGNSSLAYIAQRYSSSTSLSSLNNYSGTRSSQYNTSSMKTINASKSNPIYSLNMLTGVSTTSSYTNVGAFKTSNQSTKYIGWSSSRSTTYSILSRTGSSTSYLRQSLSYTSRIYSTQTANGGQFNYVYTSKYSPYNVFGFCYTTSSTTINTTSSTTINTTSSRVSNYTTQSTVTSSSSTITDNVNV